MTIISPSLLSCNFLEIQKELDIFKNCQDLWFHLDIMDGHFVPNLTFGLPIVEKIAQATLKPLDAHFMVTNPDFFADQFEKVKIHNFTFHWEACHHHDRMIQKLKNIYPSVGFSLNPSTPLSVIPDYLLKKVDLVLLMSVNPGFGGQSFIPEILEKIKELNQRKNKIGAHFQIQVDGGVTDKNAKILIDAGAQNLVAGSFIFKNLPQDYLNKVEALRAFS